MVSIKQDFNLRDFEDSLSEIADQDPNLRLPNKIKAEVLGGVAALAQLIVTWSRATGADGELQVYARELDEKAFSNFAHTVTGLVALNMAHKIRSAYGDKVFERGAALERSRPFVEAMHAKSLSNLREYSKTTIPLLCIDNARALRLPGRLYKDPENVRERAEFEDLLRACYDVVGPDHHVRIGGKLMESAARLVYEAFVNTHQHAQTNVRRDKLERSVRGVLVGYRSVLSDRLVDAAENHRPLQDYFRAWRPVDPRMRTAQFMDISIFDSGAGLAQTWLAGKNQLTQGIREEQVSLERELQAVYDCLKKGGTTKPGDTSGNGLFRIMEVVRRAGGFVRIRSGRLSLVKAFAYAAPPLDPDHITMEDAMDGGAPHKARSWAEGTTISVLLPLNRGADL
ncbi:hypothetical protein DDF62_08685 [Caulobacter radicis]|uniref:hypothetical protein n=1 Tax=Caulobacter radicis TaxID=2172650 RepID=UPI000D577154|nr:hypothetical protein [Caulobacter radicis]PVM90872.1 hypothetical protein DDF62_08685 [Caulobacter radicis]